MKTIRGVLVGLMITVLGFPSTAWGNSSTTDQSDIWSAPGEDGWAIQFIQRGTTIFATIYVYDPSTNPIWYTATLELAKGEGFDPGSGSVVSFTWTGDLYVTQGPWFGTVPFSSAAVHLRKVGTMTWIALAVDGGTLSYAVDGASVTKSLQRYLIRHDNFAGRYAGGMHRTLTSCVDPALNGTRDLGAFVYIVQNGLQVSVELTDPSGGCTYIGSLSQAGQMGGAQGTFTCIDGSKGNFAMFETQVNISGLTSRFAATFSSPPGCQSTGWFGGVRGTTF